MIYILLIQLVHIFQVQGIHVSDTLKSKTCLAGCIRSLMVIEYHTLGPINHSGFKQTQSIVFLPGFQKGRDIQAS
jgi:hypothetical protein